MVDSTVYNARFFLLKPRLRRFILLAGIAALCWPTLLHAADPPRHPLDPNLGKSDMPTSESTFEPALIREQGPGSLMGPSPLNPEPYPVRPDPRETSIEAPQPTFPGFGNDPAEGEPQRVPVQEELAVPGPVQDVRQSPYSIDNPANQAADHMLFEPYRESDNPPLELNLWGLENRKVFRSIPVLTPDRQWMAYTEAVYFSFTKQVMTALYLVPIPPLPVSAQPAAPGLPAPVTPPLEPRYYYARFNPDNLLPQRIQIHQTGFDKLVPNDFKTFTIVDWSQGRTRLLFRQRNGVLHYGLRTSDILVYDSQRGTVTIYPELKRVLRNYWQAPERLGAAYAKLTPDIEPIGWAAGSDHLVIFRGNALDKSGKKTFLGVWQYDIDAQRSQLLSTSAEAPLPRIASNGLIARPDPAYAEAYDRYQLQKKKYKRFHRPRKQPPVFRPAGASPDDVTKP